ncbi:MAG: LamG domain-containing protein [Planctomycetota bacterium]|jgi:hypothetical protein
MCKKSIFFILVFALALANSALAYDVGVVLKCDAEGTGDEVVTQAGWTRVGDGLNLDVNDVTGLPSVIDVTLATGNPLAIAARNEGAPAGPLHDVEADFYFANNENKSPGNDFILTLGDLQAGFYRVRSYHHRADEPDKPCFGVTVTGAVSVINLPPHFMQDHAIMELPAEIVFEAGGDQDVAIRYRGPDWADPNLTGDSSPQIYFNGFTLEYFGASNPLAYGPDPADREEDKCQDVTLDWTAGDGAASHDVYFGTSASDVIEGATAVETGWGSTSWTPPSLELGQTYYWRIDENDGGDPCAGVVWRFTANDGNAFDHFPGDGWRGISTDVVLSWSPGCLANSHDVYLGTSQSDVENATTSSAVYMTNRIEPNYNPGGLDLYQTYYWRIDEVGTSETWKGRVLSFKTGAAGVVMYYKFDGTLDSGIPSPITDSTGNVTFTKYTGTGSLTYGESNPVVNEASGTSAGFDPNAGLYREDTGVNDALRLDGYQYTIEMWIKANAIPDIDERDDPGAILFAKSNSGVNTEELTYSIELRVDRGLEFFHRGIFYDVDDSSDRQSWRVSSGKGAIKENQWYHIAAVFDITDPEATQKLYIDGQLCASAFVPFQNTADANAVGIGMDRSADGSSANFFDGLIDELRVSTEALDPADFLLVPGPEWARLPDPYDKQRRVDPNVVLEWLPGTSADSHDVYLGTAYDDVKNAGTSDAEFLDNVGPNSYPSDGSTLELDYSTTYYWRVDEVGLSETWTGAVWRFTTKGYVDDPNMILLYELEEIDGYEAFDSSGHDYIGDVEGGEDGWDANDGRFGGSRLFDDDTVIFVPMEMMSNIYNAITVSVWLKDAYRDDDNWVFDTFGGGVELQAAIPDEDGKAYFRAGEDTEALTWDFGGANPETIQGWHHWAFLKDEKEGKMEMYFDGKLVDSNSSVSANLTYVRNSILMIGAGGGTGADLEAKMDNFRVYDYALAPIEIQLLFRGGDLASAWGPQPFDGESEVLRDIILTWKPGDYAILHDVYFGTGWDDVNDANSTLPVGTSVYKGRHILGANSYDPGILDLETTYYWRVAEVNDFNSDSPWRGNVWTFKTANFLIVDNMESYDAVSGSGNEIFDTWDDGFVNWTGAQVALEYASGGTIRSGRQSMKLGYNNAMGVYKYAEIDANTTGPQPGNLEIGKDWTDGDVKALTLFFYGTPGNDANEQMYVALEDSAGHIAIVEYGSLGEDMNDIRQEEWHQWDMALSDFADAGVTITDVNKIRIGFGDRDNPVVGGSGTIFFDDIRLYVPRCVPRVIKPVADFTDDCIVNFDDVMVMSEHWLRTDIQFDTVQQPDYNQRIAYWPLDGSADDVGGNNHHGAVEGVYAWVTGRIGSGAIEFSGDGGRVRVADHAQLRPETAVSATAWVKYSVSQGHAARVVTKGADNHETFGLEVDGDDNLVFHVRDFNDNRYEVNAPVYPDEWIHLAGTFDGDTNTVSCYVNGEFADSKDDVNFVQLGMTLSQDTNDLAIGNRSDANNRAFIGAIDDVQQYSYALSQPEIAHIVTKDLPDGLGYVPLEAETNLWNKEPQGSRTVNFRDFAVMMEGWLEKIYWP